MKEPCKKTLIVGLGNPLSGDDGFGARVLEQLHEHAHGAGRSPGVALVDAHTDLLNHFETLAQYDGIVLVDAILDPDGKLGQPGSVSVFEEETFLSWPETSPGVHQVSPLLTVKLFRILHPEVRPQIRLVGLAVDHIRRLPCYATDERIALGAEAVLSLIL